MSDSARDALDTFMRAAAPAGGSAVPVVTSSGARRYDITSADGTVHVEFVPQFLPQAAARRGFDVEAYSKELDVAGAIRATSKGVSVQGTSRHEAARLVIGTSAPSAPDDAEDFVVLRREQGADTW